MSLFDAKRGVLVRWASLFAVAILFTTCTQSPPEALEANARFGDADLLHAIDASTSASVDVVLSHGRTMEPTSEHVRNIDVVTASSRVLEGASGTVAFVQHDARRPAPWRLFLHDQATDVRTLIYQGVREIESAAVTSDGNAVVFTARLPNEHLQLYRLQLQPRRAERLTFTSRRMTRPA